MTLEYHPFANLFPLIEGAEFAEFCEDIRQHGVRDKIQLYEGKILDGRNRYRALVYLAGEGAARGPGWGASVETVLEADDLAPGPDVPWFARFNPAFDGDPFEYVVSKNLRRRHMDDSQRAMVAARYADLQVGRPTKNKPPNPADNNSARMPNYGLTQADAAKKLDVSTRSVTAARSVIERGTTKLQAAVDGGKLSVTAAAQAVDLPARVQNKIAAKAEAGNVNAARTVIKQERRAVREVALADKIIALPDKKYGVIYADPEYEWQAWSPETGMDRAAANHYPTSPTSTIAARDVQSIAAADCALFLWATPPMLPQALEVMAAWSFTYKTHYVWKKVGARLGMGYWGRFDHELLLIGTKGDVPAPAPGMQVEHSCIPAETGEHSEKPELFARIIEGYFPNLPKIELNRRGPARPGWDAWGNEVDAAPGMDTVAAATALTEPAADEGSDQSRSESNQGQSQDRHDNHLDGVASRPVAGRTVDPSRAGQDPASITPSGGAGIDAPSDVDGSAGGRWNAGTAGDPPNDSGMPDADFSEGGGDHEENVAQAETAVTTQAGADGGPPLKGVPAPADDADPLAIPGFLRR